MFVLENSLQFVNVDIDYLKKLHDVCPEVYYKPYGYENKPFLGILITQNNGLFTSVNLNVSKNDSPEIIRYKNLLNKEYWFCLKIIPEILNRASKIYDRQMRTGKIIPFCCDFKLLEKTCDEY